MINVEYTVNSGLTEDYEPNDYITFYKGVAESPTPETEDDSIVQIGEIAGYLINITFAREKEERLFEIFDDYSADFSEYHDCLFDRRTNTFRTDILDAPLLSEDILFIDDVIIYPKFRRKKYGLSLVLNTVKTFGLYCGLVAIQTLPLQYHATNSIEDFKEKLGTELLFIEKEPAIRKIINYWKQLGFRHLPETPLCIIDMSQWSITDYAEYFEGGTGK